MPENISIKQFLSRGVTLFWFRKSAEQKSRLFPISFANLWSLHDTSSPAKNYFPPIFSLNDIIGIYDMSM